MMKSDTFLLHALLHDVTQVSSRNQYSLKLLFSSILQKLSKLPAHAAAQNNIAADPASIVSVVLADDDPDDRELFSEVIAAIDPRIRVTTFCDCDSLLKVLQNGHPLPDVVFLDLNMPGKNGKQCLAEIKNNSRYHKLPVVIYSTSSLIRDIQETQKIGADLFLRKPSSFNDTLMLVKKVFAIDFNQLKMPGFTGEFVLSANSNHI